MMVITDKAEARIRIQYFRLLMMFPNEVNVVVGDKMDPMMTMNKINRGKFSKAFSFLLILVMALLMVSIVVALILVMIGLAQIIQVGWGPY